MSERYVYESCSIVVTNSVNKTQVIQTEKCFSTDLVGSIFKDSNGNCWVYMGEYDDSYIPPTTVFPINYSGDFFQAQNGLPRIYYPSCETCQLTTVSGCSITYFNATRCDNGLSVVVKVCNVGPVSGPTKLMPSIGQVHGILNPSGDDFCVTLTSFNNQNNTDYEIVTSAWQNYTCNTCPIFREYLVNSCDGLVQNLKVFAPLSFQYVDYFKGVNIYQDNTCYIVQEYLGIESQPNYQEGITPTIIQVFSNCEDCELNYYNTIK